MNKLIGSAIMAAMFALSPVMTLAETTQASTQVQMLLDQVKALQTQMGVLNTAQSDVKSTLSLIRNLRQGMTGNDVAALQAALAADPDLYPEGSITGYYGSRTTQAIKRFQKKHGFAQVGSVGPKTLKKLNEEIANLGLSEENDDNDDHDNNGKKGLKLCIPPGHLIAPGWLKKHDKPVPTSTVPLCNNKGNGDNGNASTTPQLTTNASASVVVGGTIYDMAHLNLGNSPTGTITFQLYGPGDTSCATPLIPAPASAVVNGNGNYNSGNSTTTSVGTYRFIALYSGDTKNKAVATSCSDVNETVNVTAVPDTTAPILSAVGTSNLLGTTTNIIWTTNEASNSKVWYGTTTPVSTSNSTMFSNSSLVTSHSLGLSGLSTSTTYFFKVVSADAANNSATSSESSFVTTSGL